MIENLVILGAGLVLAFMSANAIIEGLNLHQFILILLNNQPISLVVLGCTTIVGVRIVICGIRSIADHLQK